MSSVRRASGANFATSSTRLLLMSWASSTPWLTARDSGIVADAVLQPAAANPTDDESELVESLTARELDVLELLAQGLANKAIADRLGISDQTVKFHVASITSKLGAANRTDAVRLGVRRGLIAL